MNRTRHFVILGTLATVLALASSVSADVIAEYNFGDDTKNASNTAANVTADPITITGLSDQGYQTGDKFQAVSGIWQESNVHGVSAHYLQIDLTIAAGYELDLTQLTWGTYNGTGATGGWSSHVRSSVDGYAGIIATRWDTVSGWGGGSNQVPVADLTGGAFDNLTGNVSFRIYAFKEHSNDIFSTWVGFDDISIEGQVSLIPEPGSMALVGLGGFCLLARRR